MLFWLFLTIKFTFQTRTLIKSVKNLRISLIYILRKNDLGDTLIPMYETHRIIIINTKSIFH